MTAGPITPEDYKTMHSMGCMLLQECTEDVVEITSLADIEAYYGESFPNEIREEFDAIVKASNAVGVKVFIAHEKYFPPMHRGVYHTVGNNFFLNDSFMVRPNTLMSVLRHEGWHAAQDCMAGTIENSFLGIIHNEEDVPGMWRDIVADTYAENVRPWEAEAFWAGHTENMTRQALESCASPTPMWETYEPTPMTREWLVDNGYIKG